MPVRLSLISVRKHVLFYWTTLMLRYRTDLFKHFMSCRSFAWDDDFFKDWPTWQQFCPFSSWDHLGLKLYHESLAFYQKLLVLHISVLLFLAWWMIEKSPPGAKWLPLKIQVNTTALVFLSDCQHWLSAFVPPWPELWSFHGVSATHVTFVFQTGSDWSFIHVKILQKNWLSEVFFNPFQKISKPM